MLRVVWDWLWPIILGCVVAYAIMRWIVSFALVPTESMAPNIPNPCYIVVDHLATEFHKPYEGEVVLFHYPDNTKEIFVKRIIGLPGDTVQIKQGKVYVNGKQLPESYLPGGLVTEGTWPTYHVPANSYFMLGDNRNVSADSRYWIHKYVPLSYIIGRADYVVWPLAKAKRIPS